MTRREFSRTIMREAFVRANGKCEGCHGRLYIGHFQYDHIVADSIGGEPTLDNCQVLCSACHGTKTATLDTPRAAKTKRQHDRHIGARPRKPWHPNLKKKLNGSVEFLGSSPKGGE